MIKLTQLIKELGINNPNAIKVTLRDKPDDPYFNDKVHRVRIDDKTEFTLHKHKNHYSLYPSFKVNSPKYAKIKEYLTKKGIKFEEFQNVGAGVINLRIPLKQIRI
jgi:hypothetical protein